MATRNDITGDELRSTGADFTKEEMTYDPDPMDLYMAIDVLMDVKKGTSWSPDCVSEAREVLKKNRRKVIPYLLGDK